MNVLLYSHSFHPSLGGLETVSLTLAYELSHNNIRCKVVTTSKAEAPDDYPFVVVRNPKRRQQIDLVKWADLVLFNGVSLALQPWVLLYRKPFIWVHQGYQVSCIDGCGWVEGERAPLTPLSSILYHLKKRGWKEGSKGAVKLIIKRIFAKYFVSKNVAITEWMLNVQPLPRHVQIYNPFPLGSFMYANETTPEYDFMYLGRIVSEKGVATLLLAFSKIIKKIEHPSRLLIIGDGNWKSKMMDLAVELEISSFVTFVGKKSGRDLIDYISKGRIAIVPSEWYEPMGGVALELMAAGKNLIVSEEGGLKECVGDAGLTFPNGDHDALARCMLELLNNTSLRFSHLSKAQDRIHGFLPSTFVSQYISLIKNEIVRV